MGFISDSLGGKENYILDDNHCKYQYNQSNGSDV